MLDFAYVTNVGITALDDGLRGACGLVSCTMRGWYMTGTGLDLTGFSPMGIVGDCAVMPLYGRLRCLLMW
jgi:hypothetical protein